VSVLLLAVVVLILIFTFFIYRVRVKAKITADAYKKDGLHKAAAAAYARAVTITPEMVAAAVAALSQKIYVECVVAIGEGDGQMAYLYQQNIVDLVVTEDSDALLTGCGRVCIYIYLMC
jgi:exonuclease-1